VTHHVYAIRRGGQIRYIGVTHDLAARLADHRQTGIAAPTDALDVLGSFTDRTAALRAERNTIAALRPPANVQHAGHVSASLLLRRVAAARRWPARDEVGAVADRPLSIGTERVCLAAATADDFERWAVDERRDAAQEASARFAACDGAEWLAREMRAKGLTLFGDAYTEDPGDA
jgi:hypothetical protein